MVLENGMRDGEVGGRFRHAAPLGDRKQDVEIPQPDPPANPIRPVHVGALS
jgi:hypothetical protein